MKETIRDLYIIYIYMHMYIYIYLRMIHVYYKNSSSIVVRFYLLSLVSIKLDSLKKNFPVSSVETFVTITTFVDTKISRTILCFLNRNYHVILLL